MPEEVYTIHAKNPTTGEKKEYTAKHDDNWAKRSGYIESFLGTEVKFPSLSSYPDKDQLASFAGVNGANTLDYSNFSLAFNKTKKIPVVTAVNIKGRTNSLAMEHEKRGTDKWFLDGRIKEADEYFQYTDADYRGSNLQKGHMVRFYDPTWDTNADKKAIAIGDTFHYTNACPQVGKYNAGIWNDLEDYYMAKAIYKDDKISVFTGPIFNGIKKINGMWVPMSFWKIIVWKDATGLKAAAFLITHKIVVEEMINEKFIIKELVQPTLKPEDIERLYSKLKGWRVKISLIEEKTGLKFGLNKYDLFKDKEENIGEVYFEPLDDKDKIVVESFMDFKQFADNKIKKDEEIKLIKSL